jgi:hypothetical protein
MLVQNGSFFTKIYGKKKGILVVRVDVEIGPTHATYDSGVACIFKQGSCSFVQEMNIVMANLHYVGVLKRNNCSVLHWPTCNIDEMFMDTCSHARECSNHVTR